MHQILGKLPRLQFCPELVLMILLLLIFCSGNQPFVPFGCLLALAGVSSHLQRLCLISIFMVSGEGGGADMCFKKAKVSPRPHLLMPLDISPSNGSPPLCLCCRHWTLKMNMLHFAFDCGIYPPHNTYCPEPPWTQKKRKWNFKHNSYLPKKVINSDIIAGKYKIFLTIICRAISSISGFGASNKKETLGQTRLWLFKV